MATEKLSDRKIEEIKKSRKPKVWNDGGKLYLRVTATGSVHWLFRFRDADGNEHAPSLGPLHTIDATTARAKAKAMRLALCEGRDPVAERSALRKAPRFAQVVTEFFKAQPDKIGQWKSQIEKYAVAVIGEMPVDQIGIEHVLNVLSPIWDTKAETARKLRFRLENVLDFAKVRKYRDGDNPARWQGNLKSHFGRTRREKGDVDSFESMPYADLPAFMATLAQDGSVRARALELAILAVCRTGDIVGQNNKRSEKKPAIEWKDLDLDDRRVWKIPHIKTAKKNAKPFEIPLCDYLVGRLRELKAMRLHDRFVFPQRDTDTGSLAPGALLECLRALVPSTLSVHGFRSTFKDWNDEVAHFDNDVAETCMSHKTAGGDVEMHYRKTTFFDRRRQLMTAWCDYALGRAPRGAVVPLARTA